MICGVWTVTDVPPDKVDSVIGGFQMEDPLNVVSHQQPNGKWTVVATFPPCHTIQTFAEHQAGSAGVG